MPVTETLTVRLAPEVKADLPQAADQKHRSLGSAIEVVIRARRSNHLPGGPGQREGQATGGTLGVGR